MFSMSHINIVPYIANYQNEIPELIVAIQRNEFGIPINLEAQPDLKDIRGYYQKDNGNFWIALCDGIVVGTIALLDIGDTRSALRKMFVHADYRGKPHRTGQALLDELLQWAKRKGFTEIYLGTTEKFLAAHRFYEKNGFIEIDKELLPERFPVMAVDVKFYKYSII